MKNLLMTVGDYEFFDAPLNKGLIGGTIIAVNKTTGNSISQNYRVYHNGKTNKMDILSIMIQTLIPPEEKQPQETNEPVDVEFEEI